MASDAKFETDSHMALVQLLQRLHFRMKCSVIIHTDLMQGSLWSQLYTILIKGSMSFIVLSILQVLSMSIIPILSMSNWKFRKV